MARRSASFRSGSGLTLHTLSWQPEGAARGVVVIAHGYAEHAGRYEPLAMALSERGYEVQALDFAGHGRSAGKRGEVRSFAGLVSDLGLFVRALRHESPRMRLGLFGHSLGGAVAAALCSRRPQPVDALVLSAPYLRHGEPVDSKRAGLLRMLARLLPRMPVDRVDPERLSRLPAQVEAYRSDPLVFHGKAGAHTVVELFAGFEALREADRLELPLLVLHGNDDRIADPGASRELIERAGSSDVTFELIDGGRHELLNDLGRERVRQRIVEWLDARLDAGRGDGKGPGSG